VIDFNVVIKLSSIVFFVVKKFEMRYCVGVYKYSLSAWMVGVLGDWLLVKMLLNGEIFNDYCFFFIYDP